MEFDVNVTQGWAGMMYWRSASLGLGRAWVWLEGEEEKKTWLWGDWGDSECLHLTVYLPTADPLSLSRRKRPQHPSVRRPPAISTPR